MTEEQPTSGVEAPPHLVTPPADIAPPHLVTPPTNSAPPHLVTPPATLAPPPRDPLRPISGEHAAQTTQDTQASAQTTQDTQAAQTEEKQEAVQQPPPEVKIEAAPEKPKSNSRRDLGLSELDNLLMHVEAGNLGGVPRKMSVTTPPEGFGNAQSALPPQPPPLPQFPKMPSGSPKLQRTFTAERALTPPHPAGEPTQDRPPSPAHNTMSEIQFSALKRDIKKNKGGFLHRLTVSHGKSSPVTSPQPPTTTAPTQAPPSATLSPPTQSVPISKKKERQSFMAFGKSTAFTIPIKLSCVSADADSSASKLVWELDVQVGSKTKVSELWERIKESGASEVPETHAICKDDEILVEKEYLNKYKLKQNDVLKIRPRTKKVVKKQLNNLIARRPSREELIERHIMATKAPETTVDSVPDVETIQRCVEFLMSTNAYKEEGLFRISAGASNAKAFYETFRKHEPDFTMIESCHSVTGAIKQYFRGLPAGLIPLRVAVPMREAFQKLGDTPELYKECAELAKNLPKPNLTVIDSVFRLVLKVIENKEFSKMDDKNCSIVFAPNVFAFDTNIDLLQQSQIQTKLVHIFFKHYEEIFGPATAGLNATQV